MSTSWSSEPPPVVPLIAALEAAHTALDEVTIIEGAGRRIGWAPVEGASVHDLRRAMQLEAELEARIAGLRLHTVAAAEAADAHAESAATDVGSWAASAGRNRDRSWGAAWLARLLDAKYGHVRAAMAEGRISEEHAAIIVKAAEAVTEEVDPAELALCEERMVARAEGLSPRRLRRTVRRLLEPLSKRAADVHEGELLATEERRAEAETWFRIGDNGDGTFSGKFTIPELHGHLLQNYLEKLSAPRRLSRNAAGETIEDASAPDNLNYTERLGRAFLELTEHLPSDGHGKSGITLVVHVRDDVLREGVGAATLETGATVSWEVARKLACEALLLPAVMGKDSQVLDLGFGSRLFSHAQAVALSTQHTTCAAEGCERPFSWCELHHKMPWSQGGPSDLANAAPLCGHHHRRIHDSMYEHEWLPEGTVRIRHRWPSRRTDSWAEATPGRPARRSTAARQAAGSPVPTHVAPMDVEDRTPEPEGAADAPPASDGSSPAAHSEAAPSSVRLLRMTPSTIAPTALPPRMPSTRAPSPRRDSSSIRHRPRGSPRDQHRREADRSPGSNAVLVALPLKRGMP